MSRISKGVAELMIEVARQQDAEIVPIRESELKMRDFLTKAHFESVIIFTGGFRSKRWCFVYNAAEAPLASGFAACRFSDGGLPKTGLRLGRESRKSRKSF
jgi:hypothetical protein